MLARAAIVATLMILCGLVSTLIGITYDHVIVVNSLMAFVGSMLLCVLCKCQDRFVREPHPGRQRMSCLSMISSILSTVAALLYSLTDKVWMGYINAAFAMTAMTLGTLSIDLRPPVKLPNYPDVKDVQANDPEQLCALEAHDSLTVSRSVITHDPIVSSAETVTPQSTASVE